MDSRSYIVLLSGGLDSVVNLYMSSKEGVVSRALTFNYGQRSAKQEITAAEYFCTQLNIKHQVIDLPWLGEITKTALVNTSKDLPQIENLDDISESRKSASAVWVPNRNGVFLNIAACFAEALNVEFVIPGFNQEEASTFPDNSPAFIEAVTGAFRLSTLSQVKVACFTSGFDKAKMVKKAKELGINFSKLWSCYQNGEVPCGECESCKRSKRAFLKNKIPWPWNN
ncbi:MAG: 7-cyano-7-deazaguanine synthase QueC [Oligoflexia bacterium]|nr:7-cyano-7-deazaguanine synthase QueC [Oligoflexia bacterium]